MDARVWVFIVTMTALGCSTPTYHCDADSQCLRGSERGACEATGFCSFADGSCPAGRRYVPEADAPWASQCVAPIPFDTTGVVLRFSFDEGMGGVVTDNSGNGHSGTVNGAAWVPGVEGTALQFDGFSSQVTSGGAHIAFGQQSFSGAAWVKSTDHDGFQSRVLGEDFKTSQSDATFWLNFGNGQPAFEAYDSNNVDWSVLSSSARVDDGQWHHLVFVVNRELGQSSIYLDGQIRGTKAVTSTGRFGDASSSTPFLVGSQIPSRSDLSLNGTVDEVWLFQRALSAKDVLALYQRQRPL